jgi:large subunit ribosomal protein L22
VEAKAKVRQVRISSTKVAIVLDLIRGKNVKEADAILQYTPKDAAVVVRKLLKSAVANAENNFDLDVDRLYVAEAYACQGSTLKRFRPRAQGRAYRILKRSSHITIVVKERN